MKRSLTPGRTTNYAILLVPSCLRSNSRDVVRVEQIDVGTRMGRRGEDGLGVETSYSVRNLELLGESSYRSVNEEQ